MFHLSRKTKRAANASGLRKDCGLTRRCPHCGKELLWEMDDRCYYVAMDYDSEQRKPHVLNCTGWPFDA